ncbi:Glyoxalase/Bleomycin resistance protein/Dihydroxybiphenyl dioxygenase [Aspergillus californicus]
MASPKIRTLRLSHVHYQHPDLDKAEQFLLDFGLTIVSKKGEKVFFQGYGIQPYCYVAERSPDGKRHFKGGYWVVETAEDLHSATLLDNATEIRENTGPGGGQVVEVQDPNGYVVGFVYGQALKSSSGAGENHLEKTSPVSNKALSKKRVGGVRRFTQGPSPVHKLGHYGFVVPADRFASTLTWYTTHLNLKSTDMIFDPVTGKTEACFIHIDLGKEYTDHHSFFLSVNATSNGTFVHHTSFEVDDFDTQVLGHDWLRSRGWTNCWGVGRHVLGSQIFDYWFDAAGNIIEHYSDGDLVNEDTDLGREPAAPDSLYIWGPNVPLGFVTRELEDAGKLVPLPPSVTPN